MHPSNDQDNGEDGPSDDNEDDLYFPDPAPTPTPAPPANPPAWFTILRELPPELVVKVLLYTTEPTEAALVRSVLLDTGGMFQVPTRLLVVAWGIGMSLVAKVRPCLVPPPSFPPHTLHERLLRNLGSEPRPCAPTKSGSESSDPNLMTTFGSPPCCASGE